MDKPVKIDVQIVEVHEKYRITVPGTDLVGDLSRCMMTGLGEVWYGRLGLFTVIAFTQEGALASFSDLPPVQAAGMDAWHKLIQVVSV